MVSLDSPTNLSLIHNLLAEFLAYCQVEPHCRAGPPLGTSAQSMLVQSTQAQDRWLLTNDARAPTSKTSRVWCGYEHVVETAELPWVWVVNFHTESPNEPNACNACNAPMIRSSCNLVSCRRPKFRPPHGKGVSRKPLDPGLLQSSLRELQVDALSGKCPRRHKPLCGRPKSTVCAHTQVPQTPLGICIRRCRGRKFLPLSTRRQHEQCWRSLLDQTMLFRTDRRASRRHTRSTPRNTDKKYFCPCRSARSILFHCTSLSKQARHGSAGAWTGKLDTQRWSLCLLQNSRFAMWTTSTRLRTRTPPSCSHNVRAHCTLDLQACWTGRRQSHNP